MDAKERGTRGAALEALRMALRAPSTLNRDEWGRAGELLRTVPAAALLDAARRHRCISHMARLAGGCAQGVVPEPTVTALRGAARAAAARGAVLASEAVRLSRRLAERGVGCMLLKGPALEAVAWDEGLPRVYDDLDVLVRRRDFASARAALVELGFVPRLSLSAREERAQLDAGWDFSFSSSDGAYSAELCTGIAPHYEFRMPEDMPWTGRRTLRLATGEVQTPGPEVLAIALAVHGAKHMWSRLAWVADFEGVMRRDTPDWALVKEWAARLGALRMVGLACLLAVDLCGAEIPADLAEDARDPAVRRLADTVWTGIERGMPQGGGGRDLAFVLSARERLRDRASTVWRLATTPSHGDWRWVGLPPRLYALYYVLRPVRLAVAACRRLRP